jgi:hypothetical protein
MLIYFYSGDKKPARRRVLSRFAILSPSDPDGAAVQVLNAHAARFFDFLDYLTPSLWAFIIVAGDGDDLDLLNAWSSYQTLDAPTYQFI